MVGIFAKPECNSIWSFFAAKHRIHTYNCRRVLLAACFVGQTGSVLNSRLNFRLVVSTLQFLGHDLICVSTKPATGHLALGKTKTVRALCSSDNPVYSTRSYSTTRVFWIGRKLSSEIRLMTVWPSGTCQRLIPSILSSIPGGVESSVSPAPK